MRRRRTRWVLAVLVLTLLSVALYNRPESASFSLVKVERAQAVDFDSGVVWLLLLGSDAAGTDLLEGRADAIQLVGVDFDAGTAVAFGVPRDSWVDLEGHGMNRINAGLTKGGPKLMASSIEDLFGIAPDYVVMIDKAGLRRLVDTVGGIEINSARPISEGDLAIRKGRNQIDGAEAVEFARARFALPRGDLDRAANHQEMMRGVVRQLAAHRNEIGLVEAGVMAALGVLDTNLGPTELYRLAEAVSQADLSRVTSCVLNGTPGTTEFGASIIHVDSRQAQRLGDDTRDDARLDGRCRG